MYGNLLVYITGGPEMPPYDVSDLVGVLRGAAAVVRYGEEDLEPLVARLRAASNVILDAQGATRAATGKPSLPFSLSALGALAPSHIVVISPGPLAARKSGTAWDASFFACALAMSHNIPHLVVTAEHMHQIRPWLAQACTSASAPS